jgi:octaprenyl-diphosphate synthase
LIERTKGADAASRLAALEDLQRPVRRELELVQEELGRFYTCEVELINTIARHVLQARGKLLRPTLLLLSARLGEPDPRRAVLCGGIVELIHTATLIHDDSIDRAFTRRGRETVNSLWNDQTSVLMGDYLYSKAFSVLVENDMLEPMRVFARATHRMSIGEMLEIEKKLDFSMDEEAYNRLILDKTAVLLSAACEVGGWISFGTGRESRLLADFGTSLGMAFQITDDILDIEGDAEVMGKSTGSDVLDGKVTLPLLFALEQAEPGEAEAIRARMRDPELDERGAAEIARFAIAHGGVTHSRQRARGYADRALELLDAFAESPARTTLHDAVEYVLDRPL